MSNLKVLMLGPGDPDPLNSGLGIAAQNIADQLSGFSEMQLIQPESITEPTEKTSAQRAEFTEDHVVSDMITTNITSNISSYWYQTNQVISESTHEIKSNVRKTFERYTEEVASSKIQSQVDVIYAHDWPNFEAAVKLSARHECRLVLHVHSTEFDRNPVYKRSWIFDLEKKAFEHADQIICVSRYSKNILIKEYGIPPKKIIVVYNGFSPLPTAKTANPFQEKIVLFVGRLANSKAPLNFLDIAKTVHSKNSNTRFIISGDGDLYDEVVNRAAELGLARKVHLTGFVGLHKLSEIYSIADVYCMPSLSEPFGLTAIEAAGAGLPMVISENCGACEILPDALLANPHDLEAFAKLVINLLDHPPSAEYIEENKKAAEELSWEKTSTRIREILES